VKIYTRKGDAGRTKLFGGVEVDKHDPRVAAYGALDELNASLGLALALDEDDLLGLSDLERVQEDLFVIGSRLAPGPSARSSAERSLHWIGNGSRISRRGSTGWTKSSRP